jgi:8-oxo-dGTP pyrophosphatase MutT (NUDIX family)
MPRSPDSLEWVESSRTRIASCSLFDVYLARSTAADGRSGDFCLLTTADWVNVVPVIHDAGGGERFLMVRQFRHGAGRVTTEFPAGLVEKGEPPLQAAERELREETGRRAGRMTLLGTVSPNPAFMSNTCYTYLAEDLSEPERTELDSLEVLEAIEVPASELERRIGTGEFINSLVLVALLWYTRRKSPAA